MLPELFRGKKVGFTLFFKYSSLGFILKLCTLYYSICYIRYYATGLQGFRARADHYVSE